MVSADRCAATQPISARGPTLHMTANRSTAQRTITPHALHEGICYKESCFQMPPFRLQGRDSAVRSDYVNPNARHSQNHRIHDAIRWTAASRTPSPRRSPV
uniref:Uncharacterized protein n=1 Tax=Eutreptiella gymnastica TaxID=73025 RepID=A0A7S4FTH4_9EUGL